MARNDISVIIPVYNSAQIFPELYLRLCGVLEKCGWVFEIIAVVDGSPDNSAEVIENYCRADSRVKMVEFARNFGHQMAVTAGLIQAEGEMVVVMDDDLEDPPEVIPHFVALAEKGYDVVYGIRKARKVSLQKRVAFKVFYRLLKWLSEIEMPLDAGDFCLLRRHVVERLNAMPERNRYVRGLRTWVGFRQIGIEYERGVRFSGSSGYRLSSYLKLGINAILSFSYKPLHVFSYSGAIVAIVGFVLGASLIVLKLIGSSVRVEGWVSLMIAVLFLGGVQLISIGVLGEYIARIYDEVKNRPLYVIKRTVGL